jgi:hypothetical protein
MALVRQETDVVLCAQIPLEITSPLGFRACRLLVTVGGPVLFPYRFGLAFRPRPLR